MTERCHEFPQTIDLDISDERETRWLTTLSNLIGPVAQASATTVVYQRHGEVIWLNSLTAYTGAKQMPAAQLALSVREGLTVSAAPLLRGEFFIFGTTRNDHVSQTLQQMLDLLQRQAELEDQEEHLLTELGVSWESLEAVYEISSDLGLLVRPQEMFERVLHRATSFQPDLQAALWVKKQGRLVPCARSVALPDRPLSAGRLLEQVLAKKRGIVLNGRERVTAVAELEQEFQASAHLAIVPLTSGQRSLGALAVWKEVAGEDFDSHTLRLLGALAFQAAMVVENDRLHQASLEGERLRQELEIGSEIQQTLLFGQVPQNLQGLEVAAYTIPSQMIDGDFYDFIKHNAQCLDVISGDVMGKGIPAALVAAAAKNQFLRALTQLLSEHRLHDLPLPKAIVSWVSTEIARQLIDLESFLTLCYARFDMAKGQVHLVDCGHTRTVRYRRRKNACDLLSGLNMPIGFSADEEYEQLSYVLEPDDIFFFYSDGLTEMTDANGVPYGEERLARLVQQNHHLDPDSLVSEVVSDLLVYAETQKLHDDVTCVAAKVIGPVPTEEYQQTQLKLLSDPINLDECRALVRQVCQIAKRDAIDEAVVAELELAVNEAVANVIEHAYQESTDQPIWLKAEILPDCLIFQIRHRGLSFDPAQASAPQFDGSQDGGFGLFIIAQSVDEVSYTHDGEGNQFITLTKKV